jgi:hypothetical protein
MLPKRRFARVLIIGAVVLVLAVLGVHVYNVLYLDPGAWRADAEPLLARARAISERARPEYQDVAMATLPPNPHNGPFYRLDDRLHEAEILEQPAVVAGADGGVIYAFDFDDAATPGLMPADGGRAPEVEGGVLKVLDHNGSDHLTNADPMAIPQEDIGDIVIRARASRQTWMTLGWSRETEPEDVWQNRLDITLLGDGAFHTYVINGRNALQRGLGPGQALARLFVKPANAPGIDVEIDSIRLLSRRARYLAAANGVLYETLGGEMRKVLYMLPDQALEWAIEVPERGPILEFGNAVLLDGQPITFEVRLATARDSVRLHMRTVGAAYG